MQDQEIALMSPDLFLACEIGSRNETMFFGKASIRLESEGITCELWHLTWESGSARLTHTRTAISPTEGNKGGKMTHYKATASGSCAYFQ